MNTIAPQWWSDAAAFELLRPYLMQQYEGQAVALYQGNLVAVGPDEKTVLEQVREQLGEVACYVGVLNGGCGWSNDPLCQELLEMSAHESISKTAAGRHTRGRFVL
jgi:hypothetical protein